MQIRAGNQSKRHFHITCHAEAGLERTITSSICNVIAPDAVLDALDNFLSRICARPLVARVRSLRSRRAYRRGASCGITFEFGVQSVGCQKSSAPPSAASCSAAGSCCTCRREARDAMTYKHRSNTLGSECVHCPDGTCQVRTVPPPRSRRASTPGVRAQVASDSSYATVMCQPL